MYGFIHVISSLNVQYCVYFSRSVTDIDRKQKMNVLVIKYLKKLKCN